MVSNSQDPLLEVAGALGIAFFGFGAIRLVWLLLAGGVFWGAEGFVDRTRLLARAWIRFEEIRTVFLSTDMSVLAVGVVDQETIPRWSRWLTRIWCLTRRLDRSLCSQLHHMVVLGNLDNSQFSRFWAEIVRVANATNVNTGPTEKGRSDVAAEDETIGSARDALATGDAVGAMRILEAHADDAPNPEEGLLTARWRVFAHALLRAGRLLEAETAAAAADRPTDAETLWALVKILRNHKLDRMAASVLQHLVSLGAQPGYVSALMQTYEDLADYRNARRVFETMEHGYADYVTAYFRVFYSLLTGDIAGAERNDSALTSHLSSVDPEDRVQLRKVHDMLLRARTVRDVTSLDDWDLRGWHYVITGAVLLHLSPFGWEDMRGRCAYAGDDFVRCRTALERLGQLLEIWEMTGGPVLAVDEPASAALAEAAARLFGREVTPYGDDREGLIVVYDLDDLDEETYHLLSEHRLGQVLYAHTSRWTDSTSGYAADVTGYLHQANTPPWGERIRVLGPGQVETIPPHPGPPSVWADYIVAGGPPPDPEEPRLEIPPEMITDTLPADFPTDEEIVDSPESLWQLALQVLGQAAAFQTEGKRNRFWSGGPVPSAEFLYVLAHDGQALG